MTRKKSALAELDIAGEALTHQDGLAERVARQRAKARPAPVAPAASPDPNTWRAGKALIQVAVPEHLHVEISILAKRRRMTMSDLVRAALNDWFESHGASIRLP